MTELKLTKPYSLSGEVMSEYDVPAVSLKDIELKLTVNLRDVGVKKMHQCKLSGDEVVCDARERGDVTEKELSKCLTEFIKLARYALEDISFRGELFDYRNGKNDKFQPATDYKIANDATVKFIQTYGVLDLQYDLQQHDNDSDPFSSTKQDTNRRIDDLREANTSAIRERYKYLPVDKVWFAEKLSNYWYFAYQIDCILKLCAVVRRIKTKTVMTPKEIRIREMLWCGALGYGKRLPFVDCNDRKKVLPFSQKWKNIWHDHVPRFSRFFETEGDKQQNYSNFETFIQSTVEQHYVLKLLLTRLLDNHEITFGFVVSEGDISLRARTAPNAWFLSLLQSQQEWEKRELSIADWEGEEPKRPQTPLAALLLLQLSSAVSKSGPTCAICGQTIEDRERVRAVNYCNNVSCQSERKRIDTRNSRARKKSIQNS